MGWRGSSGVLLVAGELLSGLVFLLLGQLAGPTAASAHLLQDQRIRLCTTEPS